MTFWEWIKSLFKSKDPVKTEPKKEEKRIVPLWKLEMEKHLGKKETDGTFSEWLRTKIKTYLGYKPPTIATSNYAWCGYIVVVVLGVSGFMYHKQGETARNWGTFANKIEWQTQGIPEGAIIWVNHGFNCNSSSLNHVGLANGDCATNDLSAVANVDLISGNSNNMVRVSPYPVKEICGVRWPDKDAKGNKVPMPKLPILKSLNCTSGKSVGGTTR